MLELLTDFRFEITMVDAVESFNKLEGKIKTISGKFNINIIHIY